MWGILLKGGVSLFDGLPPSLTYFALSGLNNSNTKASYLSQQLKFLKIFTSYKTITTKITKALKGRNTPA